MIETSEMETKEILGDKFVSYQQKFPDIAAYLAEVKEKEKLKKKEKPKTFIEPAVDEVGDVDPGFNPFDMYIPKRIRGDTLSEFKKEE